MPDYPSQLRARGIDLDTFELDHKGTLTRRATPVAGLALPQGADELELGPTIGQGGMGVVREARQPSLGRRVAFKTVQAERDTLARRQDVFREAWVSGNVEHPNVVPVYGLHSDEEGRPAFTMRYVQGITWQDLLDAPEDHADLLAATAPMEFSLDVLEVVCRALHSAHGRGVLHRDIKPDNVLLGEHGEVYLMDWGLAVALEPDRGPLRLVGDVDNVEGTPGYMSPEMASADAQQLGVPSDVFQLGAVLHRILTGDRRFTGATALDILVATFTCAPYDYGDAIDPGLAAVATRACARHPGDRYPTAEAFRRDLVAVRARRVARALVAESAGVLRAAPPDNPVARAHQLAAARRGVEEALALAPHDPEAVDLLARVDAQLAQLTSHQEELVERARQSDMGRLHASRRAEVVPFGVVMVAVPVVVALWQTLRGPVEPWVVGAVLPVGMSMPMAQWWFDDADVNQAMRHERLAVLGCCWVAMAVFWLSAWQGRSLAECIGVFLLAVATVFVVLAYGRTRFVLTAAGIAVAANVAIASWPEHAPWFWAVAVPLGVALARSVGASPRPPTP